MQLGCVYSPVGAFVNRPLQCSCCKMFGWEKSRCGTCEIDHYEGDVECLVEENGQGAKPCNWGGSEILGMPDLGERD